jgi:hypothetical protein
MSRESACTVEPLPVFPSVMLLTANVFALIRKADTVNGKAVILSPAT